MKQIITLLLLALSLIARSTSITPAPAALQAFETTYGKQKTAEWTCTPSGCEVAFEFKGQVITAVYSHSGKLRWYERHILSTQLPVALQMNLKKYIAGHWISDVKEQSGKTATVYIVTVENASVKLVLTNAGNQLQVSTRKLKA